jgi:hypothetical protein
VIVVIGSISWRAAAPSGPAGRACDIAIAAAAQGARVELVGRVGDDPNGDAALLALTNARVGHVAVLRDAARATPVTPSEPDREADVGAAGARLLAAPAVGATRPASTAPIPSPPPMLEPADVGLALEYLTDFRVLVLSDDVPPAARQACFDAAAFTGAHLVMLVASGTAPSDPPAGAVVLGVPDDDGAAAFAGLVGAYAAAVDGGLDPAAAFDAAVARGWEPAVD